MLAGGGIVNGSFLAENLVDELSLVIAPVADGGNGVGTFAQVDFLPSWPPTALHTAINGHIRLINRMILQGKVSVSTGTLFSY